MLDFKYVSAIAFTMLDETLSDKVKELRVEGFRSLYSIILSYAREGFLPGIIETVWDKKAAFINEATTRTEITEILKPSVPKYNGNSFYGKTKYHVDEEELLMWAAVSPHNRLVHYAVERYQFLFKKCLPEHAELVGF